MVRKTSLLTSKGQVTIPKRLREALHIQQGDSVVFELRDDEVVLKKHERKSILRMGGIAGGRARKPGRGEG